MFLYRASLNCPLSLSRGASFLLEVQSVPRFQRRAEWSSALSVCSPVCTCLHSFDCTARLHSEATRCCQRLLQSAACGRIHCVSYQRLLAAAEVSWFLFLFVSSTAGQRRRYRELKAAVPWTAAGSLCFKLSTRCRQSVCCCHCCPWSYWTVDTSDLPQPLCRGRVYIKHTSSIGDHNLESAGRS